eukprot:TRINITY_DN8565_c0_g2_i1.p1 TRINITY_DN8565_c0_g2~~TRINITY_DN8565_c0_g2_i1.p1  ORF type:complete len:791 (-),score=119.98 TRINITY_DN8565_c0_g2_i1:94-2430(-)
MRRDWMGWIGVMWVCVGLMVCGGEPVNGTEEQYWIVFHALYGTAPLAYFDTSILRGWNMAFDWQKAHGPLVIGGRNYNTLLDITPCHNCGLSYDPYIVSSSYHQVLNKSLHSNSTNIVHYYLSPFGSRSVKTILSDPLYKEAESRGSFMLSCTISDQSIWHNSPSFFSWATPGNKYYAASVPFLRTAGVKTATYVIDPAGGSSIDWCLGLTDLLESNGISLKYIYYIQVSNTIQVDSNISEVEGDVRKNSSDTVRRAMGDNQTDVWFLCARASFQFMPLLYSMRELDYLPNLIVMNTGVSTVYPELSHFIASVASDVPNMQYPADNYFGTNQEYYDAYEAKYNETMFFYTPTCTVSILHFLKTLQLVQKFEPSKIEETLLRSVFTTAQGSYSFDIFHDQLHEDVFMQLQVINGVEETSIVGPFSIQQRELVYPMPKWSERIYSPHLKLEEYLFIALYILYVVLTSLSWSYLCINHKNDWEFKTGNPILVSGMIVSSWVLLASVLTWPLNVTRLHLCYVRVWLLDVGFVLLIGFLSAKIFKVVRIVESSMKLILLKISDHKLVASVALLSLVHIILLSVWTILADTEVKIVHVDPFRPSLDLASCSYHRIAIIWVLVALDVLLYIFCVIYAVRLHRFKNKNFNESRIVGFGMYNIGFFSCLIFGMQYGLQESLTKYYFRSSLVFLAVSITVFMIIGFRLKLVLCPSTHDREEELQNSKRVSRDPTNSGSPSEGPGAPPLLKLLTVSTMVVNVELLRSRLKLMKEQDIELYERYKMEDFM